MKKLLKSLRYQAQFWKNRLSPPKDVLVYAGLNHGRAFDKLFHQYRRCFGFEANPQLYQLLQDKYAGYDWVRIVHGALVGDNRTEVKLLVTDNKGASSSLYPLKDTWHQARKAEGQTAVNLLAEVAVPAMNLQTFLRQNGVDSITDYISDIEGLDLAVLETLAPFIKEKRIETITCEVSRTLALNRYVGGPDNSKDGFMALLGDNYELVAEGYSPLADGVFQDIPQSNWAVDCRWKARR